MIRLNSESETARILEGNLNNNFSTTKNILIVWGRSSREVYCQPWDVVINENVLGINKYDELCLLKNAGLPVVEFSKNFSELDNHEIILGRRNWHAKAKNIEIFLPNDTNILNDRLNFKACMDSCITCTSNNKNKIKSCTKTMCKNHKNRMIARKHYSDFYTQYLESETEYRIHVIGNLGKSFEKVPEIEVKNDLPILVRNFQSGYRLKRRTRVGKTLFRLYRQAIKVLNIDFGVFDILKVDGKFVILEINTKPLLSENNQKRYLEAMALLIETKLRGI
jgi:hypothetical protein